ncbi:hypothetical protein [Isoptericola sp. NPDC019482]|uniref:hypothetical protein n=1 Tax=Isoptericola sp. NPDC019482 TaxID=3154688 RepID=UPI0034930AE8
MTLGLVGPGGVALARLLVVLLLSPDHDVHAARLCGPGALAPPPLGMVGLRGAAGAGA